MPANLTSFAEGAKAIADAQRAALQYQYDPQQAAVKDSMLNTEASIQTDAAIEQRMKIEDLQKAYQADTEISSKLAEIYGKNPDTEPADALTAIIPNLKGKAQLTAISKLPTMQKQQAEAQSAKYARQQQRQDAMYSRVADIPPSELSSAILGMIQDKTMSPEEGQQATQIIAKVGPEEAQRIFRKMHTTDSMRREQAKKEERAEEARHNLVMENLKGQQLLFLAARSGASTVNNDAKNSLALRKETIQELNSMIADRNALSKYFKDYPERPEPEEAWIGTEITNQAEIDEWDAREARIKALDANIEMGQEVLKQTNSLLSPADKKKEKIDTNAKPKTAAMPANVKSAADWEAAKKTLRENPGAAAAFDSHFGAGAAEKVLSESKSKGATGSW